MIGTIAWHGHHENKCPMEYLLEGIKARRQDILAYKSHEEWRLRLRLLQEVQGTVPDAILQGVAACDRAQADVAQAATTLADCVLAQTQDARDQAYAACTQAIAVRNQAYAAFRQTLVDNLPAILELHAQECPDCPWDGQTIFPVKKELQS